MSNTVQILLLFGFGGRCKLPARARTQKGVYFAQYALKSEPRYDIPSQLEEITDLIPMVDNAELHTVGFNMDDRFCGPIDELLSCVSLHLGDTNK